MNDSDLNDSNYELKTKKRSFVWKFFERIGMQRVRCLVCNHEQNYQGTTGNILRHLKARHDLDATLKGQQDPRNQERIRELCRMISSPPITTNAMDIDRKPKLPIRKTSMTSASSDIEDPYSDNCNNQETIENRNMFYESVPELQEDCLLLNKDDDDHYGCDKGPIRKSAKRTKLEEDRIVAETEYFREKAAYFRLQKHYTALQAKKVKLEIEQMAMNNKNLT